MPIWSVLKLPKIAWPGPFKYKSEVTFGVGETNYSQDKGQLSLGGKIGVQTQGRKP